MDPDVGQAAGFDRRQELGHAVDERFGADEAGGRGGGSHGRQPLAAAKADFELDRRCGRMEQLGRLGQSRVVQAKPEARQQIGQQPRL